MNKERLLKLAAFLETVVDPDKFNMNQWCGREYTWNHCGSAGCALGYACTIPEFFHLGLKLDVGCGIPTYETFRGFNAACAFFDLSLILAESLFTEQSPGENPRQVASRIRKVCQC